jgi:hypothetical protein
LDPPDIESATTLQLQIYISFSLPVLPFFFFLELVEKRICHWYSIRLLWNTLHQFSLLYKISGKPSVMNGKYDESDFFVEKPPDSEDQVSKMSAVYKRTCIQVEQEKERNEKKSNKLTLVSGKEIFSSNHTDSESKTQHDFHTNVEENSYKNKSLDFFHEPLKKKVKNTSENMSILSFLETIDTSPPKNTISDNNELPSESNLVQNMQELPYAMPTLESKTVKRTAARRKTGKENITKTSKKIVRGRAKK